MPVTLITGAAKRLGAAMARKLHQHHYNVMIHYNRAHDEASELCAELNALRPHSAAMVQAAFDDPSALQQLIPRTIEQFGQLDCLINNASEFNPVRFRDITMQTAQTTLTCNALVPLLLAQQAQQHLEATQGCIINLVDIHADKPLAHHLVYSTSKAALKMITQGLAVEMAPHVRVNAIAPGAILWPETSQVSKQAEIQQTIPLQRTGELEDIASAALFLAQQAHYMTGQTLYLDGGRTVKGYQGAQN